MNLRWRKISFWLWFDYQRHNLIKNSIFWYQNSSKPPFSLIELHIPKPTWLNTSQLSTGWQWVFVNCMQRCLPDFIKYSTHTFCHYKSAWRPYKIRYRWLVSQDIECLICNLPLASGWPSSRVDSISHSSFSLWCDTCTYRIAPQKRTILLSRDTGCESVYTCIMCCVVGVGRWHPPSYKPTRLKFNQKSVLSINCFDYYVDAFNQIATPRVVVSPAAGADSDRVL